MLLVKENHLKNWAFNMQLEQFRRPFKSIIGGWELCITGVIIQIKQHWKKKCLL